MDEERPRFFTVDISRMPEEIRAQFEELKAAEEAAYQARKEFEEVLRENGRDPAEYLMVDGEYAANERKAPCSNCLSKTLHKVLHAERREFGATFEIIECAGCGRISFAHTYRVDEERWADFYPSPISRQTPWWLSPVACSMGLNLLELCAEIYEALWGGQRRLAMMGVRSLIEQVMIRKIGDQGSFAKNLDKFCQEGFISQIQYATLGKVLDAGHAAMHRGYQPKKSDLNTALDILEGVLAAIYAHPEAADELSHRVPQRPPTGKVIPWRIQSRRQSSQNDDQETE